MPKPSKNEKKSIFTRAFDSFKSFFIGIWNGIKDLINRARGNKSGSESSASTVNTELPSTTTSNQSPVTESTPSPTPVGPMGLVVEQDLSKLDSGDYQKVSQALSKLEQELAPGSTAPSAVVQAPSVQATPNPELAQRPDSPSLESNIERLLKESAELQKEHNIRMQDMEPELQKMKTMFTTNTNPVSTAPPPVVEAQVENSNPELTHPGPVSDIERLLNNSKKLQEDFDRREKERNDGSKGPRQ